MIESSFPRICAGACLALTLFVQSALSAELRLSAPGAPEALTEKLRAASLTLNAGDGEDEEPVTPQDLLAAARADYSRMVSVLYGAGYFGGQVSIRVDGREAADIPPLERLARIGTVAIEVRPGARFAFSRARIRPLATGTTLPEGFAVGQPAEAGVISDATQAGITAWRAAGHAKAELRDQKIIANHERNTLRADVRLRPGPRLTFGDLIVQETDSVRPDRIREIAGLPEGEVFSPDEMKTAANRLRRTGTFRSVSLQEAETANPDGTLDIVAEVVDEKPRRIGFGAELSSLEGLTLSGFWLHRNLLGGAERLRIEGEVGGIGGDTGGMDYSLSARYERPATFTPDTTLYLGAAIREEDEPDYRERSGEIGGGFAHVFSDELEGQAGVLYRYSEVDDDFGSRTLDHLMLPAKLTWDTRDDPLDATDGFFVDVEATPFAGLAGSAAGGRLFIDSRAYLGFGADDRFVLAGRVQLGSVMGAEAVEVPPSMLFYSGGAGTVRGQSYQSLSIELPDGRSIGGRSFLAFSGELRAPVRDKISVVAFYDTGYVGKDSWGTESGDWHSGAGLGLRYDTGIGPIRLDVATPVDGDDSSDVEIYIGIGQAF